MRIPNDALRSAALLLMLAGCTSQTGPVRIGLAGPFSSERGASMHDAAVLAATEINRAGGVGGRPIELVFKDDSADAGDAVRVARELYADPSIVAVVGHLTSGTTIAAAPVYNGGANPLVEISPSASSPELSHAGPYTFRICPTDLLHGARLADWAAHRLGAHRAAVLYINDAYGRGVRSVFEQSFRSLGGTVVSDDPYLLDLPSFDPYLRRVLRRGGADVLMIAGTRAGAERILPALAAVGWSPAVMGGDGLTGLEMSSVNAQGVYISSAYLPDRPGDRNQKFVEAYGAAYPGRTLDHRGAGAYDIIHLLARAIAAVGPDRAKVRDYLAGVGSATPAYDGVTGRIAFDSNGDVPDKAVVVGVVRNHQLLTAEGQ